jgi:GntR family transcriptional regulator
MDSAGDLDVLQPDILLDAFSTEGLAVPRETLAVYIARRVLEMIRAGKLPVGARLPSEPRLAEMFQVSRNTLREAIRLLIAQGVLEARKGIGTFVQGAGFSTWPVETGLEELTSTTDIIASAGHLPGSRSYRFEIIPGRDEVTSALLLDANAPVYHLTRVRLADQQPVILCDDYLPASLMPEDVMRQFDGQGSLFAFLAARNRSIAVARAVLKPVVADSHVAEALAVSRKEPLLLLKQTHFDSQNQPLLYSDNYINSAFIGFHVRRMPPAFFASHPAHQLDLTPEGTQPPGGEIRRGR